MDSGRGKGGVGSGGDVPSVLVEKSSSGTLCIFPNSTILRSHEVGVMDSIPTSHFVFLSMRMRTRKSDQCLFLVGLA